MFGYICFLTFRELGSSISGCIASNDGKNEGKIIWKEWKSGHDFPNFKHISWHLFGSDEKNHENQTLWKSQPSIWHLTECYCLARLLRSCALEGPVTSALTVVNTTTASHKSMRSRRTAWQVRTSASLNTSTVYSQQIVQLVLIFMHI